MRSNLMRMTLPVLAVLVLSLAAMSSASAQEASNQVPVAEPDSATTDEDTAVVIAVLANDTDPDGGTLSVESVTQPAYGSSEITGDAVTYTPDADFNGDDSFDYTVSDGQGGSATTTVTVEVSAVNDPPVANDDSAVTSADASVEIDILANDSDVDSDEVTLALGVPANGTVAEGDGDRVTYTPDDGFIGTDSFTYTIEDTEGASDGATVTIMVGSNADLAIKVDVEGDGATGDEVTLRVRVENDGPSDASGVAVSVSLSDGLTYVSDDGAGAYDPASGTWSVGDLALDAKATLFIVASVEGDGAVSAQVAISASDQPDADESNNSAAVAINDAGNGDDGDDGDDGNGNGGGGDKDNSGKDKKGKNRDEFVDFDIVGFCEEVSELHPAISILCRVLARKPGHHGLQKALLAHEGKEAPGWAKKFVNDGEDLKGRENARLARDGDDDDGDEDRGKSKGLRLRRQNSGDDDGGDDADDDRGRDRKSDKGRGGDDHDDHDDEDEDGDDHDDEDEDEDDD